MILVRVSKEIYLVDKSAGFVVAGLIGQNLAHADNRTYYFKSNDTYQLNDAPAAADDGTGNNLNTTSTDFMSKLAVGDQLDRRSVYSVQSAATGSVFALENLSPSAPTGQTAEARSDTVIRVEWTAPTVPSTIGSYEIQSRQGTTGDFAAAGTVAGNASPLRLDVSGLTANTEYQFRVRAVVDGVASAWSGTASATTLAAGATLAPRSIDATVTVDGGFIGEFSSGDTWRILFDKTIDEPVATDVIRVQDGNGNVHNLQQNASNSTWARNANPVAIGGTTYPANRVLTITFAAGFDASVDGSATTTLSYPLTITASSGCDRWNW